MTHSNSKIRRLHEIRADDAEHADEICHSGCGGQAAGMPLRRTFGFDPIEDLTLDVMRCIWNVYATGSAQGWDVAIRAAEEQLGSSNGPGLVAHATAIVRALGCERQKNFMYLSFGCRHVSSDELAVMTFIKACRLRNGNVGQNMIRILLGGDGASERSMIAGNAIAKFQLECRQHGASNDGEATLPAWPKRAAIRGDYLH